MPTGPRREDPIVLSFLSVYQKGSWADAKIEWLDKQFDKAIDARATKRSDGKRLAIEHTIIEPYVGEKEDFSRFKSVFPAIEDDKSLLVPGKWIRVFIASDALRLHKKAEWPKFVNAVHDWVRTNRLSLPQAVSHHRCRVDGLSSGVVEHVALTTKVVPLPGPGRLHVRRQQTENSLGDVIEKALTDKLPKLITTDADEYVLLLERQHMNLFPDHMLTELAQRKGKFPDLDRVNQVWIVETMGGVGFERYENGVLVESFYFDNNGELIG